MSQIIRFETPEDVVEIHALTAAAFLNAPHTVDSHLPKPAILTTLGHRAQY